MSESIAFARSFVLQRDRDISGVSGTGIVADGVVFPDGHAAIHWRGKWALTTPHPDGLESIIAIHDHGGRGDLHIVWADGATKGREILAAAVGQAYALADRWLAAHGSSMFLVRTAGAELGDALDESGATVDKVVHSTANVQASGLTGVDGLAAATCSAQYTGVLPVGDCIRAAGHIPATDHTDDRGRNWGNNWAEYPSADVEQKATVTVHLDNSDATFTPHSDLRERLADAEETCDELAYALRQVLAVFHEVKDNLSGNVIVHEASYAIHPSNFNRWSEALARTAIGNGANSGGFCDVGIKDTQACPYCTGGPQFPREQLGAHVESTHARVLAALARGVSLDEQLSDPETRCRLPHDMEV